MLLRDADRADALEVASLHVRAWQAAYRGLLPPELLDGLDPAERAARYTFGRTGLDGPHTVVAVVDGCIAGFVTSGACREDPTQGEVYALYVDPDRWRHGIGRALLSSARASLAGWGFAGAVLWVLVGNCRADHFYRAQGWLPDGAAKSEPLNVGWQGAATVPATLDELRYRAPLR